jgi:aminopeptidase N
MPALALLLAATLATSAADDSLMAPGVSRVLAEWRARRTSNVRYDLALDVTRADTAYGRVVVRFRRTGTGDAILDFRGPTLRVAAVNGVTGLAGANWNRTHVRIPSRLLRVGENVIEVHFTALIAPAGASIIRVKDAADGASYLYTLLVPSDANALFPCFDQPDLKARTRLTLVTPPGWKALGNGSAAGERDSSGVTVHRFTRTPPLSTYLVAFAAGPWRTWDTNFGRPVTLWARASRARDVEVDTLAHMNAIALDWLGDYFARPYAFEKYDFLLAPAFPFGGMEHPGAVFFNEESFVFRERPTLPQRIGRQATTFHEVAHQWFGDFTTMRWFDDLWLKEGFATYMAAKMQDALTPEAGAWKSFYLRNKPVAYDVDATLGTTPVWQSLDNLDQAKSNYGPIVYNKAPGILKQLEFLVGERAFRDGVRRFLRSHAYANATWRDLLNAVGTAAGRDLQPWGRQYILRPGMPVVEPRLELRDGRIDRLVLVQRAAQPDISGAGVWPMRLQLLLGDSTGGGERLTVDVRAETTVVAAARGRRAPAFVFANAGDQAYARVTLDARSTAWAERHVGRVRDDLLRAMLWGALWDEVRDARLDPDRFVAAALRELRAERDEQILAVLVSRLVRAGDAYLVSDQRDARLEEIERALLAGASDTARPYGPRKTQLDGYVSVATSDEALRRLAAWLADSTAAGLPLRSPTRWAIVTTLVARAAAPAESLLAAETRRDTTPDARRRAFAAAAARPTIESKREYFRRYFGDTTLNEEWVTASLRAFNDPRRPELTAALLRTALDSLPWIQRNRRIFFLGQWLGAWLGGQRDDEALATVDAWLRERPSLPRDLRQKVLQARDELERTARLRRRWNARASTDVGRSPLSP